MENLVLAFAIIGVLGIGAQWLAWRFNLPAIVLMAVAGILAGPVFNIFSASDAPPGTPPMEALFGDFYRPIIAVAVAVILFEGGLQLNFSELRGLTRGVRRLVLPGVPIAWFLAAIAGYLIAGLTWQAALLFGGIMVVTGPTVIIPLLRQSRLNARPATLLKWEGIVNDPIGALLAVLVYEFLVIGDHSGTSIEIVSSLVLAALLSAGLGFAFGRFTATSFRRGWVPEYLKPPVLLALVLVCFELANLMQEEAGLLSVTAMGVTLANSRIASIDDLRLFKENITVMLVSGVFIILTANLTMGDIAALDWRSFWFIIAMLFVVRPLTVLIATVGAGLPWKERLLVGWIAPRGIVAVAVTGFFGASMTDAGYLDGDKVIALAFAMVFATVALHGFSISPLAKALGLASRESPGVLIIGASPFAISLATKLKEMEIPVMVADTSWRRLKPARLANVETYYGEILSEVTEHHLDLNRFGYLLALGGNEAHNALVATDLAPELGRAAIFQVNARGKDEEDRKALSYTLQGRTFLQSGPALDELVRRHYSGWIFQRTKLSDEYPPEQYKKDLGAEGELVLVIRKGVINFASPEVPVTPETGDIALAYIPKPSEPKEKPAKQDKEKEAKAEKDKETAPDKPADEPPAPPADDVV
ncbi:cation:proton antiporter [Hyphococcus luteus]|uniref:Sodium:proton exchanger n=1 Tax=Hyphococcus luteus TaxID=2058213 RepID=A0A2S7JZG5_9PROT|nr:sodium:proton antiporter [Marinicaulis flavus]PQA85588.1 sodium:proton exchanger [Marinicaulis flavus]